MRELDLPLMPGEQRRIESEFGLLDPAEFIKRVTEVGSELAFLQSLSGDQWAKESARAAAPRTRFIVEHYAPILTAMAAIIRNS